MSARLALKVETRVEELGRIFAAVEELAEQEDWPPGLTFKVNLVLEELGINVINYAYDGGLHYFDITLISESDRLTIEITDDGRPFNPLEDGRQPDLNASVEDRRIGGLGIYLARELTDNISYRRELSKNHSTMVILKTE